MWTGSFYSVYTLCLALPFCFHSPAALPAPRTCLPLPTLFLSPAPTHRLALPCHYAFFLPCLLALACPLPSMPSFLGGCACGALHNPCPYPFMPRLPTCNMPSSCTIHTFTYNLPAFPTDSSQHLPNSSVSVLFFLPAYHYLLILGN